MERGQGCGSALDQVSAPNTHLPQLSPFASVCRAVQGAPGPCHFMGLDGPCVSLTKCPILQNCPLVFLLWGMGNVVAAPGPRSGGI